MWLTHRYFEQVKQAERLDQKVTVLDSSFVDVMSKGMKFVYVSSSRPKSTRWRASAYGSVKQIIGTE
jgi:hypothetical protein